MIVSPQVYDLRSAGRALGQGLVAVLCVAVLASRASADEPRPRAAVAVSVAPGTDAFVAAYVYEVGAAVLRRGGFEVAPPLATRAILAELHEDTTNCADDDVCLATFAQRAGAPTLLLIAVAPAGSDRASVKIRAARVHVGGVTRLDPVDAQGAETEMGRPVERVARALAALEPPCELEVVAADGLLVEVAVDGHIASTGPLFVPAGAHSLRVSADGRAAFEGSHTCVAGRRYRVRVR